MWFVKFEVLRESIYMSTAPSPQISQVNLAFCRKIFEQNHP